MEIKARAWDYVSKQMVYGVAISEDGKAILPGYKYSIFSPPIIRMSPPMLYTGLTLSDGTDIYEGDVLRLYGEEPYDNGVVGMDYDWEFFGTVVFQDGSFVVQEFSDKCCIWIDAIFCEDIDVEKLGNIHDNPELVFGEEVEQ
jgi:hypothetical protein